jgi:hypothetical protein
MNEVGDPWIMNCATAAALCTYPGEAIAIATTVSDVDTVSDPEYCGEFGVGRVPFNV